ncbi:DUF2705 family protein [Bacillus rubiinfantis]|uniref:DUF2705 family protein n=1 Tax=Bacillus rubiinfantis TaxID=1499680 RepID=UPI0005AA899A|nr:DUF2705 family protein [Bacillus rubiinfantis]
MRKLIYFTIFLIVVLVQNNLMYQRNPEYADMSGFMVLGGLYPDKLYFEIAIWYLFFAALSFSFIGYVRDFISGYGIYTMIRGESRGKLLFVRIAKLFFIIFSLCCIQILVSIIFSYLVDSRQAVFFHQPLSLLKILFLYILSMIVLIYIQVALELWFSEQIALLIINIYVLASVSIAGLIFSSGANTIIIYWLIPNFGMYQRTDLANIVSNSISSTNAVVILLFAFILLSLGVAKRVKKFDVI